MEIRANAFYNTAYPFIKEEAPKEAQLSNENIRERIQQSHYFREKILLTK
jgi:hypothetical protein